MHTISREGEHTPSRIARRGLSRAALRGTTLVELVVALVVITVALLALAGAAAIVARETATGRRELALAWAARSRLERLTGTPCPSIAGGSASTDGMTEQWTVDAGRNGTRRLVVTVEMPGANGRAIARRLEGIVTCA